MKFIFLCVCLRKLIRNELIYLLPCILELQFDTPDTGFEELVFQYTMNEQAIKITAPGDLGNLVTLPLGATGKKKNKKQRENRGKGRW